MTASRRDVLLQGCVIGAGVVAANMSGIEALAQTQIPERRSLEGLAWNDPIVATYRDAVGIMKQTPDAQQFSWVNLSQIHGSDPNTYNFCPHGNWYFLPWHRGYLIAFEAVVRDAVVKLGGPADWALPYWNYFKANQNQLPNAFASPDWPDGRGDNPLYVRQRYGPNSQTVTPTSLSRSAR